MGCYSCFTLENGPILGFIINNSLYINIVCCKWVKKSCRCLDSLANEFSISTVVDMCQDVDWTIKPVTVLCGLRVLLDCKISQFPCMRGVILPWVTCWRIIVFQGPTIRKTIPWSVFWLHAHQWHDWHACAQKFPGWVCLVIFPTKQ